MRELPSDPFAYQARVMSAMCDDLFDMGARRSTRFARMNAPIHGRPSMTGYQIARVTRDRNAIYRQRDLHETRGPLNPMVYALSVIAWVLTIYVLIVGAMVVAA